MACKVIVAGAPRGQLSALFTKLSTLHAKQSFACAIIVGDVFASPSLEEPKADLEIDRLIRGEIPVALPTYFTLGASPLPPAILEKIEKDNGEVCENLFFLGKKAVLSTSEGIRIIALGGRHDASILASTITDETTKSSPFYSSSDAATLRGSNYADLLITHDWPLGITNYSSLTTTEQNGSQPIADLTAALRPRYHFACGNETFYEREPYRNDLRKNESQDDRRATRFIAIASYNNPSKSKAFYAFTLNPTENPAIPPSTTASPFQNRKRPAAAEGNGSFFFTSHTDRPRHQKRRHNNVPTPTPETCFFCLSNPSIEKHLIVSIGNDAYLTTAKGPLTSPETNPPGLPFSAHILIIPFAHSAKLADIDDPETKASTVAEMKQYRIALEKFFGEHGAGAVTFEVRPRKGVHAHWQVIPVSLDKLSEVVKTFSEAAPGWVEESEVGETEDAFTYWISGEEGKGGRSIRIPENEYFDLQFGRKVVAKVLGIAGHRGNWKDCVLDPKEEERDAGAFKTAFKTFDIM